jgi:hypothetical protein
LRAVSLNKVPPDTLLGTSDALAPSQLEMMQQTLKSLTVFIDSVSLRRLSSSSVSVTMLILPSPRVDD